MKYWWVGVLFATFLVATYCIGAQGLNELSQDKMRTDIITIDGLKAFGYLEKPPVVFLHDAHTEALQKIDKDCSACHFVKADLKSSTIKIPGLFNEAVEGIDPLSTKFKRLEDTARKDVMEVYHTFCIDCHTQMGADELKSGPVTCGGCHKEPEVQSSRREMGFDLSLHWRHTKAHEKKCEVCHHEYDEQAKKLVYAKGKEGTCRYCHKDVKEENRISMREASHLDCVNCHRKVLAQNKLAGPVKCAGCHSAEAQAKIKKVEDLPRMERNQPDAAIVKTGEEKTEVPEGQLGPVRMNPVAFNHKAHETYNDTCRGCHHAAMESCAKCHTMRGDKDGDWVKLEQAYHLVQSRKSCMGCHDAFKEDPKCAGCHVFMQKSRKSADDSCLKCHSELTPAMEKVRKKEDGDKALAQTLVGAREFTRNTYADEDIPEKVVINVIRSENDKYEPVEMPHRKVAKKLLDNIKDNKMATYFHMDPGTLCQGCHHNTPLSKKPPKCLTCHGKPFDENVPLRPGLLGAYHQQCMTCHTEMGLEKPAGCTGCHKEKQK